MTDDKTDKTALDACFEAARARRARPSEALMSALLADAEAQAADRGRPAPSLARNPRPVWRVIADGLGGWPALTGLAATAIAGLWIGLAAPEALIGGPFPGFSGQPDDTWIDPSAELALGLGEEAF